MEKIKTYQVTQTIVYEYFIEANSEDEALMRIDKGYEKPTDKTEIALKIVDKHDGDDWINEPTK